MAVTRDGQGIRDHRRLGRARVVAVLLCAVASASLAAVGPGQLQGATVGPIVGAGADCVRLLARDQRVVVVTQPADFQRAALLTDDGRLLLLRRADRPPATEATARSPLTLVEAPDIPPTIFGTWPEADCTLQGWSVPRAGAGEAVSDELSEALIAIAADTETRAQASARPGGLQARAERRAATHDQVQARLGDAAALSLNLQWLAIVAAIDAGKVVEDLGPGERRLQAMQTRFGEHGHASLQTLIELADALATLDRHRDVDALLGPRLPLVRQAIGAGHRQTLQLERQRVNAQLVLRGGPATVAAAQSLLADAERALPVDDPLLFDFRFLVARALLAAGRYVEAIAILEPLMREIGDERSLRASALLDRLATSYTASGRLSEGLLAFQRSYLMTIALVDADHPHALRAINNYGNNLRQLGDNEAALPFARQAYEGYNRLYGAGHVASVISARGLSLILGELGRPDESLQIIEPQIHAAAERLGPEHRQTINTRIHQAELLDLVGRYAASVAVSESVIAPATKLFGDSGELTIVSHTLLAGALAGAGDRDRAREQLAIALERIQRIGDQRRALALLRVAAKAAERIDDDATLEPLLRQFVDITDQTDRSGLSEDAASQVQAFRAAPYMRYVALLGERGEADAAFDLSERFKGRVLLASLGEITSDSSPALPEPVRVELLELRRRVRAAEAEVASAATDAARIEAGARREAAAQAYLARRASARRQYPRFGAIAEAAVLTSADIARVLAADTCLLSFVVGETRAGVFVAGRFARVRYFALPAPMELDAAVQKLRSSWAGEPGPASSAEAATLSRALGPAMDACPVRATKVVVSPDGAVALLPFEMIEVRGRPIGQRYAVSYVQSFSVYGLLRRRPLAERGKKPLLAVGAPSFQQAAAAEESLRGPNDAFRTAELRSAVAQLGNDAGATKRAYDALGKAWPPLPGAEREVRSVSRLFSPHTLLLGDQASEERLADMNRRGELAKYRFLLFSTHGYLSLAHPMLSAIVLRQPGAGGHDGYLTAAELPLYDLDSDLIVLSACETGVGQVRSGSGVMGLPLALTIAGNRNAVVTLWRVADASAAQFVERLFWHLRGGASPAEALARTKRAMAKDRRYSHPMHWAGFVLYGAQ